MSKARMRWGSPPARHVILGLALGSFLILAPGATAVGEEAQYVGSALCLDCHADQSEGLSRTHHGRKGFSNLTTQGCESCHGPGSLHVNDPDIEENRPSISRLTSAQQSAMCTQCHDGGDHMFWKGSRHETRGVGCLDCHSVHSYKSTHNQLKTERDIDTCFTYHADVRADSMRSSHHPVREGKMSCMDCHTPHGSTTSGALKANSVNDLCYTCHAEKRGPFLWEHAPVRESCLTCHTPHGSNHQKLQWTSVPYLCQQCHINTRHPGSLYDAQTLPGQSRASNRLFERACVNCHPAIHGSNHPSGPYLGR